MPFAWTPAALDDLHRLYVTEKLSARQTARALGGGVTRSAVLGKTQRLGWKRDTAPGAASPAPAEPRPAKSSGAKPLGAHARPRTRIGGPFSKVLPLPELREVAVDGTPKPWTERGERECAFPVGEPAALGEQLSCCARAVRGRPYCPAHGKLMTVEGTALTARDMEIIVAIARRAR